MTNGIICNQGSAFFLIRSCVQFHDIDKTKYIVNVALYMTLVNVAICPINPAITQVCIVPLAPTIGKLEGNIQLLKNDFIPKIKSQQLITANIRVYTR